MSKTKKIPYSKRLVKVTPDLAKKWIAEANDLNYRFPKKSKVAEFAQLMRDGKWMEAHVDAIQFDWNGNLGNGQHRLLALIEADKTYSMYVEEGVDPDCFLYTDKNVPRSGADDLAFAGYRRDVSHKKAFAVANRMLMGLEECRPIGLLTKELAVEHEHLIGTILLELKNAHPWRSEIAAAFCKATFDFPESEVLLAARRYASKNFTGDAKDPLMRLHDCVISFRLHGGKPSTLYRKAVSAIRAELEGRVLSSLYETEEDFLGPWQDGYIPLERREKGRKGAATRVKRMREGDRMATARAALAKARERGYVFFLDKDGVVRSNPVRCPPSYNLVIKELKTEVVEILKEEAAAAHTRATTKPAPAAS